MEAAEKIVNYLDEKFKATDNRYLAVSQNEELIIDDKASFLIEASIGSVDFKHLFRKLKPVIQYHVPCCQTENKTFFKLPNPDDYKSYDTYSMGISSYKDLYFDSKNKKIRLSPHAYSVEHKNIDVAYPSKFANETFNNKSAFKHCKELKVFDTPEHTCQSFSNSPFPYDPIKLEGTFKNIHFYEDNEFYDQMEELKKQFVNEDEPNLVHQLLKKVLTKNIRNYNFDLSIENTYNNWLQQVFSFKNEYGNIVQKVLKYIPEYYYTKQFIPYTCWLHKKSNNTRFYCIPIPEKQILFNLDKLESPEAETVILTDAIDIAALNQRECKYSHKGIVWTSWLSDSLDQVNWEPLKKFENVHYLITNHSDMSLAEAYVKAGEVKEYLKEKHGIKLNFIQLEVDFNDQDINREQFKNLKEIFEYRNSHKPEIIEGSILSLEGDDEFNEMLTNAENELNAPKQYFWEKKEENIVPQISNQDKPVTTKLIMPDYLLRPGITRGELMQMRGQSGQGKTSIAYSLCGAIVAGKSFIKEKLWHALVKDSKIIYFDFESGENRIEQRRKEFMYPYVDSAEGRQDLIKRFFIKDMSSNKKNFTDPCNHQEILDVIEENRKENGDYPDMVVFDTYSKLTDKAEESPNDWGNAMTLFDKIRYLGIAVFIIHQTKQDGKSKGFGHKLEDLSLDISIENVNGSGTLETPRKIRIAKFRDNAISADGEEFMVRFTNDKWQVWQDEFDELDEDQIKEELTKIELDNWGRIVGGYRHNGFPDEDIIQVMPVGKTAFYEKVKAVIKHWHESGWNKQKIASMLKVTTKKVEKALNNKS